MGTSKGIRILTIKGKKVVTGKTIRKVVKEKKPKKGKKPKGKKPKKERKPKGKKPKKGGKGKKPKNGGKGKKPKKGGKKPTKGVSFFLGRFPGLYTFRFPKMN